MTATIAEKETRTMLNNLLTFPTQTTKIRFNVYPGYSPRDVGENVANEFLDVRQGYWLRRVRSEKDSEGTTITVYVAEGVPSTRH